MNLESTIKWLDPREHFKHEYFGKKFFVLVNYVPPSLDREFPAVMNVKIASFSKTMLEWKVDGQYGPLEGVIAFAPSFCIETREKKARKK